ncbi:MAG: hypothetical protein K1X83_14480 [Oligoflexia bacterium]|nr:hypothetical protein [Oligoflexia bacterium]
MEPRFDLALREILQEQASALVRLDPIRGELPRFGYAADQLFYRIGVEEMPGLDRDDLLAVQAAAEEQGVMSRQTEIQGTAVLEFHINAGARALEVSQSRLVSGINAAWEAISRKERFHSNEPLDEIALRRNLSALVAIEGELGGRTRFMLGPTSMQLWMETKIHKGSSRELKLRDTAAEFGLDSGLVDEGESQLFYLTGRFFDDREWQIAARALLLFVETHGAAISGE